MIPICTKTGGIFEEFEEFSKKSYKII